MYEVDIIDRDVIDATVNLIEELVPLLLKETVLPIKLGTKIGEVVISVHDAFFWKKFRRLLENGDLSEDARAKFCGRLESEGEDKKKECARRIIQIVDQAETDKKMDFIINATFSFANYYIDKTTYFRICNAVNNSLQEDLEFLQMNFSEENELPYSDEVQGLINQGLMEKEGPQWQSFDEQSEASKPYKFTLLAKYVDKYALSNSDFERYPDLIRGGSTGGQTNCR